MKTINRSILVAPLLAAIIAAGCGSVRKPEITLTGMRLGSAGLTGATLIADLEINNRNDFTIETDSITYQLFGSTSSDGKTWSPLLQRTFADRIVIKEDDITRVAIPIEFNYRELSGAAGSILQRGTFNYRIEGHAFVREPMRRTIPFNKTGSVSISGIR